jgi:hypothetical protein
VVFTSENAITKGYLVYLEEGNTGSGVVPAGSRPDSTWGKQFKVVSQDSVRPNGAASAYRPRDVLSNVYF